MQQPCPHCDQLDTSLLCLVLIDEILSATESRLVLLADVMYQRGLLQLSDETDESEAAPVKPRQGSLHTLRRSGADNQ
jgi:hypothetical protein